MESLALYGSRALDVFLRCGEALVYDWEMCVECTIQNEWIGIWSTGTLCGWSKHGVAEPSNLSEGSDMTSCGENVSVPALWGVGVLTLHGLWPRILAGLQPVAVPWFEWIGMIPRYWGWSKHGVAEPSNRFWASVVLRLGGGLQHVAVPSKMFFLFGFSFCCGWARSHPRLLWLGLLPRHVCGENVSVLVPVAPVCLLSKADGHDVIWRFYCGCLQYDAVPSYRFRGASWPYRRSAWEECFDVPLRASKSLGRWAKYPVAFSMASVGNPF